MFHYGYSYVPAVLYICTTGTLKLTTVNILVIEDETRVATLVQRGLEEQGYQVTLAYDGEMGKKLALSAPVDLIITDIVLPKINGLDLCRQIREVKAEIPIIMLTAMGTTDDKVVGFDAGADDYLVKPFEMRELLARVRALLKRNTSRPTVTLLKYADLEIDLRTKSVRRGSTEISLTPKEMKLLEFMVQNPERILTRSEIAEKVWDTTFDTGTNFIDVYINYLRKKIDRDFPVKLIHTRSGMGFIFKAGNQP